VLLLAALACALPAAPAATPTPGNAPPATLVAAITLTAPEPAAPAATPGDVAYLMIPVYTDTGIAERLIAAFEDLAVIGARPLTGIVLDLRLNTGGLYSEARQVLGLFADGTVGLVFEHGTRYRFTVKGQDVHGSQSLPLVVLVGPWTESSAEVSTGILQDIGRAQVVGQPSAGNVEILVHYDYLDGSRIWLAEAVFRPLNNPDAVWEGQGITPDVVVEARWEEFSEADDPQLEAALELLGK
jgi:C-terminal processing protease CtpA/Prc